MRENFKYYLSILLLLLFLTTAHAQQNLTTPRISPFAQVTQTIGLTDLTVTYHRPAVNGRTIWGALVPYDQVWRAGANENTTFESTDPFFIDGRELEPGSYGIHILPGEKEWLVIFSNVDYAWGSFTYSEAEDALRVKVVPQDAPFCERLIYYFDNPTANTVDLVMHWEKLRIKIPVQIDVHEIVLQNMQRELRGLPGFYWQSWNQAATYATQNNVHLEDAMQWIDRSIGMSGGRNFSNYRIKADLLKWKGQQEESALLMKEANELASESDLNNYGYQLLFGGKTDEAIKIFKMNVERHPDSWNTYDSLGEAYAEAGNIDLAIDFYKKALSIVTDDNQKQRINNILKGLQAK